ncbi:MAG: hypothetical protein KA152_12205 [Verrucomicrobiales bacterium]|nr:hypothetical protein [Verrucomicrobiales bacterium]HQW28948.1 YdjY domain-containing protein [Verrucomicrobiales bacterium]
MRHCLHSFLLLLVVSGGSGFARSQETAKSATKKAAAAEELKPEVSVKKIGETLYRIGEIEFDAKSREIRVPVTVNMREGGPIEYLLVNEKGKVHESIFTTAVSPTNLQIAMKLLRFKAGRGDVFNRLLAPEFLEKEGGIEADRGDSVSFFFEVTGGGKAVPAYEFVIDGESAEAMKPGGWIYTGSVVEGGNFMAETEGSIIAIYLDEFALFNMTRAGADLDDRWGTRSSVIPEIGTKGILIIQQDGKKAVTKEK